MVKVFITKQVKANGGSVLAPYQITRGTLPSIAYAKGAGEVTSRGVASPFFVWFGKYEEVKTFIEGIFWVVFWME